MPPTPRSNTSRPAVDPRSDDVATSPFAPPAALSRPRNGSQTGLDGNTDPMRLGVGGVDVATNGILPQSQPGNPFGGRPAR